VLVRYLLFVAIVEKGRLENKQWFLGNTQAVIDN
jgi:hypothetical protein